jgi:polysaccharide export outer membrane protein
MTTGRCAAVACLVLVALLPAPPAGVADAKYRIGPEDVLTISVWDNKDVDQTVFVRPDGQISLPLLGEVQAGGLTVEELASKLTQEFAKTIKDPQVTVGVKEIRSRPVFFVGGFGKTGPLQLTQDFTLLQAIAVAGGLVPTADLESAFVIRNNTTLPINFVRLVKHADISQNIKLEPGDTVVVPVADVVYVQGEVKTPGSVKFSRDLTVVRVIAAAGGFTNLAAPRRVSVLRAEGGKKETLRINVDDIMRDPSSVADVPLQPNDIIIVPQRLF